MKNQKLLPILAFFGAPLVSPADTFHLNDGSTIEGTVLRETADSYVVEVQITKTIKDEKTLAKENVSKVELTKPGENEFEAIANLLPVPDQSTVEDYSGRITAVQKYLAKFKYGPKDADARKILEELKKEANEVIAGGIKIGGRIIPAQEYRPNAYEIDARAMESRIRGYLSRSQWTPALRLFQEMGRQFPNTTAYTELAPLAARAIQSHQTEVKLQLDTFEERAKDRAIGLDRMTAADRAQTEAALAEQAEDFAARLAAEKDAKIGWVTTDPTFRPSLEAAASFSQQELKRVSSVPSVPKVDAGKLYRDAYSAVQSGGEESETKSAIEAAKTAGVGPSYISALEAAAAR